MKERNSPNNRPSNGNSLFLSSRKLSSEFAHFCIVTLTINWICWLLFRRFVRWNDAYIRKGHDEIMNIRHFGRFLNSFLRRLTLDQTEGDVLTATNYSLLKTNRSEDQSITYRIVNENNVGSCPTLTTTRRRYWGLMERTLMLSSIWAKIKDQCRDKSAK